MTVNGRQYADLAAPLHEVGALLEARAVHTSRSAYNHLRALAATHGIPRSRVDEVIDLVGLTDVARKRAGGFSLGMGQRLGIASALLGDPPTVILDEPVNGLDPEGIRWVRDLLKGLAAEGRTVFVSSHLMSEMALTAEHVIVVGRGRLIADTLGRGDHPRRRRPTPSSCAAPTPRSCATALAGPDVTVSSTEADVLQVTGPERRPDRRHRPGPGRRPARAHPAARLAGGGLHDHDPRRRRVPRPPRHRGDRSWKGSGHERADRDTRPAVRAATGSRPSGPRSPSGSS